MRGRVVRRGGELVVVISEQQRLPENTEVDVMSGLGALCAPLPVGAHSVRPVDVIPVIDSPTIEELVAGITDDNRHEETAWGPPVGNELW